MSPKQPGIIDVNLEALKERFLEEIETARERPFESTGTVVEISGALMVAIISAFPELKGAELTTAAAALVIGGIFDGVEQMHDVTQQIQKDKDEVLPIILTNLEDWSMGRLSVLGSYTLLFLDGINFPVEFIQNALKSTPANIGAVILAITGILRIHNYTDRVKAQELKATDYNGKLRRARALLDSLVRTYQSQKDTIDKAEEFLAQTK